MNYKDKTKEELIQELDELQKHQHFQASFEEYSNNYKKNKDALSFTQTFNETLLNSSPYIIYIYDIVNNKNLYSNEVISKVLDRFYFASNGSQKSKSGTGLGLSIVYEPIALLNDKICVEIENDKGSTFYFALSK